MKLTYYDLAEPRDGYSLRSADPTRFPEFKDGYTSHEAAIAAGNAVFDRIVSDYKRRLEDYDPLAEAGAAKRAWESPERAACHVETRIVDHNVAWARPIPGLLEWSGTLRMTTETRHRWREVEMVTETDKKAVVTVVHRLGKPRKWSAWSRCPPERGGLYVPQTVSLVVRGVELRLAGSPSDLEQWVRTCRS